MVLVPQDEHPDKVAEACRYDQVGGLADEDAPGREEEPAADPDTLENDLVPETAEEPGRKTDHGGNEKIAPHDVLDRGREFVPDRVEHKNDDADGNDARDQNGTNLPIHAAATRA
jgi:hypothetical protein